MFKSLWLAWARMFKWLWGAMIWHPDAISPEDKDRATKRLWLPLTDLLYIVGGFSAARFGVPAINEFFPDAVVDVFGYGIAFFALVCLVGVSFVKLWWLEILGKCILLGLMAAYVTALMILTSEGHNARGFIFVIGTIATIPLLIGLSLTTSAWAVRRAKKRGVTK